MGRHKLSAVVLVGTVVALSLVVFMSGLKGEYSWFLTVMVSVTCCLHILLTIRAFVYKGSQSSPSQIRIQYYEIASSFAEKLQKTKD